MRAALGTMVFQGAMDLFCQAICVLQGCNRGPQGNLRQGAREPVRLSETRRRSRPTARPWPSLRLDTCSTDAAS
jgi:hypothetical protein